MNFRIFAALFAVTTLSACGIDDGSVNQDQGDLLDETSGELSTKGRFETFVGKDGQHYFHLLAGNGQKVLRSEGYASASGAASGIASVQANGITESRYLYRDATDGSSYFVLTAANGEIIGVSQMYSTSSNAVRAVTAVIQVVKITVAQAPAPAQIAGKFEVFKGLDAKFYFHLKALNGEIVLQSQAYTTRASATAGVASVQTNGSQLARYSVLAAADGKYYFVLKAANGAKIGHGETYASKWNAERGVEGVVALLTASR